MKRLIMALTLTMGLTIAGYQTDYAHKIEIESAWSELGDTCTIQLPNLQGRLEQAFQVGDPVQVVLGYNGENRVEFSGYITEISPKFPFKIMCEDGLYLLKRASVGGGEGASYRSITLRRLLETLLDGFDLTLSKIPEVSLSPYRIENGMTVAQVLQKLKEDYGLAIYFRGNQLFAGLPYTEFTAAETDADRQAGRWVDYHLRGDQKGNVISEDLTYRRKEDKRLKGRAVSILEDNSRIEVEVGDPEGEIRTLTFRNIRNKDALREIAEQELERVRYDGYEGSIITFGRPYAIHSATAALYNDRYPDRAGRYLVDQVSTTWSRDGYRRELKIGPKVSTI